MPFFLKSKEMMTKLDEPLFTYLICQSLGNTYRYQDLYEESLVQLKELINTHYDQEMENGYLMLYRSWEELMCIKMKWIVPCSILVNH